MLNVLATATALCASCGKHTLMRLALHDTAKRGKAVWQCMECGENARIPMSAIALAAVPDPCQPATGGAA